MILETKTDCLTQKNECSSKIPLLDTKGKFVRQKSSKSLFFKQKLFKMREVSSQVLSFAEECYLKSENKYPAICLCGRFSHNKQDRNVLVAKGLESQKSFYSGLVTCGSVWRCPVCSYKITKVRQLEVFKLLTYYQSQKYAMSFVTLTMRHKKGHSLKITLNSLLSEFRKFQRVRKFSNFRSTYIGMIKAVEITYSEKNGWHPHLHIIFVHKKGVTHDYAKSLITPLLSDWANRPSVNGKIKAQNYKPVYTAEDISEYVTKWDASREITQGNLKMGKGSSTAFGIIADVVDGVLDLSSVRNILESYNAATKGKNHLIISGTIREDYKKVNPHTVEDLEVVKDEIIDTLLFSIGADLWREILSRGLSPALLHSFDCGGMNAVYNFLKSNNVDFDTIYQDDLKINILY